MAIEGIYLARPAGYPAPFLQAVVELPRLGLSNEVDFPLDTGADNTVLNPFDILNLNLDRIRLHPPDARSRGIGGQLDYHTEPANLHFLDGQTIITWHCENLRICADIADPHPRPADRKHPIPAGTQLPQHLPHPGRSTPQPVLTRTLPDHRPGARLRRHLLNHHGTPP